MFINQAIKCYEEIWKVVDRAQLGCLKNLRAQAAIKTVQELIHQNPLWKEKIISRELNILTQSMSCLIRDDQHMRVHSLSKRHLLTPAMKVNRQTRVERLLQWHAENWHENTSSSPLRSSRITRTRFMLKHPVW